MMRDLIRRWLGIHDDTLIRAAILAEIDADAVWRAGPEGSTQTMEQRRAERSRERRVAIAFGNRENPGA